MKICKYDKFILNLCTDTVKKYFKNIQRSHEHHIVFLTLDVQYKFNNDMEI